MKSVVGLYNSVAKANEVKSALVAQGYNAGHITMMDQAGSSSRVAGTSSALAGSSSGVAGDESLAQKVKNFFSGFSEHQGEHSQYANSIGQGGALLSVTVPDEEAENAADFLHQHGATGIQGDYGSTNRQDYAAASAGGRDLQGGTAVTGEQVIPVVQEELVVGKREVERGGVRIYSHVVEKPVSAEVALHEERVVVDRRPVNRAATEADFATGDAVVELTAKGEEAVVGKTSRVVEEVRVGKEASEHTEQVSDTVRRTEVDVEPTTTTKGTDRY